MILCDKKTKGVGPGLSFAIDVAMSDILPKGQKIGLIPCAVGGSGITEWLPENWYFFFFMILSQNYHCILTFFFILWRDM